MQWETFAGVEPRLAGLGRRRLGDPGLVLVGTTRADGTARISPVEPLFWGSDLWLPMMYGSSKVVDLRRDARVLVHNAVADRDGSLGEYKVRGRAVLETDPDVLRDFAAEARRQLGWLPDPSRLHVFRVDVLDVTFVRYDAATGDQFTTRWPERREYVRRATSATSVGEPEPYSDLLSTTGG